MEPVFFQGEAQFRDKVERLFAQEKLRIQALLPDADIQHVGSTAIPGSLTKGDLDIQVRVRIEQFAAAVQSLAALYDLNEGSMATETFRAFTDDTLDPPLGVQLTVIGGAEDFFWRLRDFFVANPAYRAAYDQLKQQYQGKDHDEYRAAKGAFIERLMQDPKWRALAEGRS